MTTVEDRRRAEFPQYERPAYFGMMRPWRENLLREWLTVRVGQGCKTYLDVGCGVVDQSIVGNLPRGYLARPVNQGPIETRPPNTGSLWIAGKLGLDARGCDVVESVCNRYDVDLVPGVHDLSIYAEDSYDLISCNDVMEHVLEEDVGAALSEMRRITKHALMLGICRKPGTFHITIKSEDWWMQQIAENMPGTVSTILYADRIPKIKRPYMWVDVQC